MILLAVRWLMWSLATQTVGTATECTSTVTQRAGYSTMFTSRPGTTMILRGVRPSTIAVTF